MSDIEEEPYFISQSEMIVEINRLRDDNERFFKQAEMNARLLTENASLRAENEKLHREAAIRIDQIEREQEAHLRTISDYNRAMVKNDKLHKALKNILDDATHRCPVRMTCEVSEKVLFEAEGALNGKN